MKTRKLGGTDLNLTTIGLGTWAIGGGDWTFGWGRRTIRVDGSDYPRDESGINWVDTAPAYGLGAQRRSRRQGAEAFPQTADCGDKNAASCGTIKADLHVLNAKTIKQEVGSSLKRLDIDVYRPVSDTLAGPGHGTRGGVGKQIGKAVKEGKLRYAGSATAISRSSNASSRFIRWHRCSRLYSMIERGAERSRPAGLLPRSEHRIVATAHTEGFVDRQIHADAIHGLPGTTTGRNDPIFKEPRLSANFELVEN